MFPDIAITFLHADSDWKTHFDMGEPRRAQANSTLNQIFEGTPILFGEFTCVQNWPEWKIWAL